jgi:hypothetical protein
MNIVDTSSLGFISSLRWLCSFFVYYVFNDTDSHITWKNVLVELSDRRLLWLAVSPYGL